MIEQGLATPKIDVHCHVDLVPGGRRRLDDPDHDWTASADHLVACAEKLRITECWCSSPISAGRLAPIEEVRGENDVILAAMARHPRCIRGLCFVIPGPDAVGELNRCLDAGMIGIKLYNQYRINDPIVRPIIEVAVERKVPILEHAGAPTQTHKADQPLISHGVHFAEVSERYPDAIIYHAHMGGGGDWEYTIRAIRDGSPNLYIDVSGSNLDRDQVGFAVNELGAERVLFGTDGTMVGCVGKIIGADITDQQRQLIWWDNAERILSAQGASPTAPASGQSDRAQVQVEVRNDGPTPHPPLPGKGEAGGLLDLNAWLGSYPFRSISASPESLLSSMDRHGITGAAVSSIESAYHRNVQSANEALLGACEPYSDFLFPLGTVSAVYPKWEQDLKHCVSAGLRGIRIIPQCHGYRLNGPAGHQLLEAISETGLPVFIPARLEDIRQRHWIDPGSDISLGAIADVIARFPDTTFVVNNARGISRSPLCTREETRHAQWFVDLSLAETDMSLHWDVQNAPDLTNLVNAGDADRIVFGSHEPFSYATCALTKLYTLEVNSTQRHRIAEGTARRILRLDD